MNTINIDIDIETIDTPKEIIGDPITSYENYYVAYDSVNDIEIHIVSYKEKMYMAVVADGKIINPEEL